MYRKIFSKVITLPITLLTTLVSLTGCEKKLSSDEINRLYSNKLPPASSPIKVYHLGHSLVGKDMPAMLKQLAGEGHQFNSQLGWGATLQSHWDPEIPINGFDSENKHEEYRDPHEAIESQEYDAFVMTEMVEIKDAIKYFDTPKYFTNFVEKV